MGGAPAAGDIEDLMTPRDRIRTRVPAFPIPPRPPAGAVAYSMRTHGLRACWVLLGLALLGGGFGLRAGAGETSTWSRELEDRDRMRMGEKIQALDGPYNRRLPFVLDLVRDAQGPSRALVVDQLHRSLDLGNMQIRLGVVEVLARIGDPASVDPLIQRMIYEPVGEVRMSILRHLPLFCIPDPDERDQVRDRIERDLYEVPPRLRAVMRQPPVDARGRFDATLDRTRQSVTHGVVSQLDAVDAAIDGIGDPVLHERADATLVMLLGRRLGISKEKKVGPSREDWRQRWRARGETFPAREREQLDRWAVIACRVLRDMGAEGTPYLTARLERLIRLPAPAVRQAALETLATLTRLTRRESEKHRLALADPERAARMSEAESAWHKGRVEGARRLAALARETIQAERPLLDPDPTVRAAAFEVLGSLGDPTLMPLLRQRLREGDRPLEVQLAATAAAGDLGGAAGVAWLREQTRYRDPPVGSQAQQREQMRLQGVLDALGRLVMRRDDDGYVSIGDPATSRLALAAMLSLLDPTGEGGVGIGRDARGQPLRLRDLARAELQNALVSDDPSYDPADWRRIYAERLKGVRRLDPSQSLVGEG